MANMEKKLSKQLSNDSNENSISDNEDNIYTLKPNVSLS